MAFKLNFSEYIEDINSTAYLYEHSSGGKLIFIENNDEERVFSIAFETLPCDSKGTAHIVEHSVLCGSEHYKLKDPFNILDKGSIHTYLNAMTYSDRTIYPVASTNEKDLKAMMRVYCDAVFDPLMYKNKGIFLQEGWHSDGSKLNGVVLNEMKGVYSDSQVVLDEAVASQVYRNTPYRYDSGGDPDHITELTYEEFLDFHSKNYHPSNAVMYLYGKLDINEYLDILDKEFLYKYEYCERSFDRNIKAKDSSDVKVRCKSPSGNIMTVLFDTGTVSEFSKCLMLDILCDFLFNSEGAFIKEKLRPLGKRISADFNDSSYLTNLSVTVEGAEGTDLNRFKKTLNNAFKNVEIDEYKLKGIINSYKFYFKEEDFGYKPKGLFYCTLLMRGFMYGNYSFEPIRINKLFKAVESIDIKELIRRYFIDKGTYGILIDTDVKKKIADVPPANNSELIKYQAQKDADSEIAKINVSKVNEISKEPFDFKYEADKNIYVNCENSDVIYIDLLFDTSMLKKAELPALGVLQAIADIYDKSYSNDIDYYMGGFDLVSRTVTGKNGYKPYLQIKLKALRENIFNALDILQKIISIDYSDVSRVNELIQEHRQSLKNRYITSGQIRAYTRALSSLFKEYAYMESAVGFDLYRYISDTPCEKICVDINNISKKVFTNSAIYALTSNEKDRSAVGSYMDKIIEGLQNGKNEKADIALNSQMSISADTNVNFNAIAFPIEYDSGIYRVVQQIVTREYIWDKVRLEGGAYGGACRFTDNNKCYMYSYRDPQLANTYDIFEKTGQYLQNKKTQKEIDRFILGAINEADMPVKKNMLNSMAIRRHILGITYEKLATRREELLSAKPSDIIKAGQEIEKAVKNKAICTVGRKDDIKNNIDMLKEMKTI